MSVPSWLAHVPPSLAEALQRRILVLDGAMGTMIQQYKLTEADFRGELFKDHPHDLKGNNDILVLTRPDVIGAIHKAYLDAGADIVETNTFNSTSISQADYQIGTGGESCACCAGRGGPIIKGAGLPSMVYDLNVAAAKVARAACAAKTADTPDRPRFVAGALGPTNKTASISPRVNDPGYRAITFDELVEAYAEQVRGLMDGGVDLLLPETTFDTLNLKAALYAIEEVFQEKKRRLPIMISVTITDASGRTLSGQTTEAFWYSVEHAAPMTVGINCALGAEQMRQYVEELSGLATCATCIYPNAGLPNPMAPTGYDETPEHMAGTIEDWARRGWLNVIGGCCGTTPAHIAALAKMVAKYPPRAVPQYEALMAEA